MADGTNARRERLNPKYLPTEVARDWLAWQCKMIAGLIRGALYHPTGAQPLLPTMSSIWPGEGEGQTLLLQAATQALTESRCVVLAKQHYGPENSRLCDLVASPILVDSQPVAVVAMMLSIRSQPQLHAVLQLLQWGGLWMESMVQQQATKQHENGIFSLALMTAILGSSSAHIAAMEAANQLADRFGCERVGIGFRQGLSIRLQVLSHVATFDSRSQMVCAIEAAMEEAVTQHTNITLPNSGGANSAIVRAHAELKKKFGLASICTIPLPGQTGSIGAITFERSVSLPFYEATINLCKSLSTSIGLALEMKQRSERAFWIIGWEALFKRTREIFGPAYLKLKLITLSVITLLVALAFIDGNYQVTAPARIEGSVHQILVAPQDGYIKQALARAGDVVNKGQLIALLDDRHLRLEQQKWRSERNKIEREYQEALAKRDRTELSILRAQLAQVDAELHLVEEKILRSNLRSPLDGVVASGDLSQLMGASVETGQVLFEIASLDNYRVVLEVDDQDIADLDANKSGHLIIAALPQAVFDVSIDRVIPVAVSENETNFFRVEASLNEPSTLLRPGMRGVAKVNIGSRKLLWIWTHAVVDRFRLWLWSVGL